MTDDKRTQALSMIEQGEQYPEIAKAVYGVGPSLTLSEPSSRPSYAQPRVNIPKTTTRSAGRHMRGKRRRRYDPVLILAIIAILFATATQMILAFAIMTGSR